MKLSSGKRILILGFIMAGGLLYGQGNIPGMNDTLHMVGSLGSQELPESRKPEMNPQQVKIKAETGDIRFEVNDTPAPTGFTPEKPDVREPEKEEWPYIYNNYAKAAFGRFATPVARLYLHNGRSKNLDLGIDLNHISASNGHVDFGEFREDFGTAAARVHLDNQSLGLKASVFNTNYFYYADSIIQSNPEKKDSIRQAFTKLNFEADILQNQSEDLRYGIKLGFRDYFDRSGNSEVHASADLGLDWKISSGFSAGLDGNLTFSNAGFDSISQSRTFLDFSPYAGYQKGKLRAKAGLKVNSFSDSVNVFNAAPILNASFELIENRLALEASMQGEMRYNTWYDFVTRNKWLDQKGNVKPTTEKIHFRGGFTGGLPKYLSFSLHGYWRQMNNMPVFFCPENGSQFAVLYDSVTRESGIEGTLQVNVDDKYRAGFSGTFRQFQLRNTAFNFGVANTRFDFWASCRFADKVWITTEVYLFGKRSMTIDSAGTPISANAQADINLTADYSFSKRISIFLELNNILGNRYYRWYNYRERPFDVKAGVSLSF